ncbi:MAG: dTMP kinase, partial [Oceanococcus sp.]
MSGYFFVFDGMDGSGKSTALQAVAKRLKNRGHTVVCTREPGGSPLAERIRECMLADWEAPMPIQTELLLVFAARAAHMEHTVLPALNKGHI